MWVECAVFSTHSRTSTTAPPSCPRLALTRHGRACPGHPRLYPYRQDVDARHKAGHDGGEVARALFSAHSRASGNPEPTSRARDILPLGPRFRGDERMGAVYALSSAHSRASGNPEPTSRARDILSLGPRFRGDERMWVECALSSAHSRASTTAPPSCPRLSLKRHGRACPGHPRLYPYRQDVDARHKAGHDGGEVARALFSAHSRASGNPVLSSQEHLS